MCVRVRLCVCVNVCVCVRVSVHVCVERVVVQFKEISRSEGGGC